MNGRIDVAVVGGGPIGLATALHARAAGLDVVVVVEPRSPPIDKACGEGLMPSAVRRLQRLGVDPPGRPILGIRYLDAAGRRQAAAEFTSAPGRGVCRTTLHSALIVRAKESDVTTMTGRVVDLSQDASGASVTLATGEQVRARYVVGADGLHSRVRRTLGLEPARARRPRFGQRRHFAVEPWTDLVEVHWAEHVEAYVTPVSDYAVGVALLTSLRGPGWHDLIGRFPLLQHRLAGVQPLDSALGAGPLRQNVAARVRGRVLLVGDAAGYVDALTGEGLAVGLASAEAAVAAIGSGHVESYEQRWRQESRRSRWLTHGALFAAQHQALRRGVVPVCSGWPSGFTRVVNALG